MDIVQLGDIDFVRDAKDLSCFADGEIEEIYASHILEHFPKRQTQEVLNEWARVLRPGGIMWVSVPDFDAVVDIYLKSGRFMSDWLGNIVHGDQDSQYAFHYNAFNFKNLSHFLARAGFSRTDRLKSLPYGVRDASTCADTWFGMPISVSVKAIK